MENPYQFPILNPLDKAELTKQKKKGYKEPVSLVREENLGQGSWQRFYSDNSSKVITSKERQAEVDAYDKQFQKNMKKVGKEFKSMLGFSFPVDSNDEDEVKNYQEFHENIASSIEVTYVERPEVKFEILELETLKEIATKLDNLDNLKQSEQDILVDSINQYVAKRFGGLPLFEILRFSEPNMRELALTYRLNAFEALVLPSKTHDYSLGEDNTEATEDDEIDPTEIDFNTEVGLIRLDGILGAISNVQTGDYYWHGSSFISEHYEWLSVALVTNGRIYNLKHFETLRSAMQKGPADLERPCPDYITPIASAQWSNTRYESVLSLISQAVRTSVFDEPLKTEEKSKRIHKIWDGLIELHKEGRAVLPGDDSNSGEPTILLCTNYDVLEEQMLNYLRQNPELKLRELKYRHNGSEKPRPVIHENVDSANGFEALLRRYYNEKDGQKNNLNNWYWRVDKEKFESWRGQWVAFDEFFDFLSVNLNRDELIKDKTLYWEYLAFVPLEGLQGELIHKGEWWRYSNPEVPSESS